MFLSKRALSGVLKVKVYFLTVVGASNEDEGKYICKVVDLETFSVTTEDLVNVNIILISS